MLGIKPKKDLAHLHTIYAYNSNLCYPPCGSVKLECLRFMVVI